MNPTLLLLRPAAGRRRVRRQRAASPRGRRLDRPAARARARGRAQAHSDPRKGVRAHRRARKRPAGRQHPDPGGGGRGPGPPADPRLLRGADGRLDRVPARARVRQRAAARGLPQAGRHDHDAGRGGRGGPGLSEAVQARRPVLREGARRAAAEDRRLDDGRGRRPRLAQGRRLAQAPRGARGRGGRGADQPRAHRDRRRRRRHPGRRHRRGRGAGSRGGHRQGLRGVDARGVALGQPLHHPDGCRAGLDGLRKAHADGARRDRRPDREAAPGRGPVSPGQHGAQDRRGHPVRRGRRPRGPRHARRVAGQALEGKTGTYIRPKR